MKALLIDPEHRSIEAIEIVGHEDIARLIGFDTVESDAVGNAGDRLFFDEECFLRGAGGRFQLDTLIPIAGKALIVGTSGDGTVLRDAVTDVSSLGSRLKYL
ncbi:MAG: hypothetical protein IPG28_06270 [Betaproteobacteria bacterium]|jgi:hypothetical protein|nr:hypothetical protein [Betaproteobacteria bacterium]MBK7079203.1 hypothetical protein [Betaproteobacteria bacterium]MBK7590471.1 hypothetical protein [Betaproteobacteria bacterium]MBK7744946.1 hypothetical protein [Betaproteobacteria bacterium]MBK8689667.1 hypothetical protein [Betaproteobacteria bacterium]